MQFVAEVGGRIRWFLFHDGQRIAQSISSRATLEESEALYAEVYDVLTEDVRAGRTAAHQSRDKAWEERGKLLHDMVVVEQQSKIFSEHLDAAQQTLADARVAAADEAAGLRAEPRSPPSLLPGADTQGGNGDQSNAQYG